MDCSCLKVDYLTISLLQGSSGRSVAVGVNDLLLALGLQDELENFDFMCSTKRYEAVYRWQNISLKLPSEEKFGSTGICIEFSGQGLDFYEQYLSVHKHKKLREVLNSFRLLYLQGYKSKCSRIDIACDDKCFGDDRPLLVLNQIESVLKSRYFVSKFRRSEPKLESGELVSVFVSPPPSQIDDKLPYTIIESQNLSSGDLGKTIYLGKRRSSTFVRIYDKKAEKLVKGDELPEGLTHWVRFEMEFHGKNASAVLSKFLDCKDDIEFSQYISRVAFNLIRFVDKDHTRLYNCTVCDWWLKFLGSMADKGMYINKLSKNRYIKFVKYVSWIAACLSAVNTVNPDEFQRILEDGSKTQSKTADGIISDYNAFKALSPPEQAEAVNQCYREMSGKEYWRLFAGQTDGDFDDRMEEIAKNVTV